MGWCKWSLCNWLNFLIILQYKLKLHSPQNKQYPLKKISIKLNSLFNPLISYCAALPKPYVSIQDFYREFHLGLCLGAHKNLVTTYDVAFETSGFYVFTQEYAPLGEYEIVSRECGKLQIMPLRNLFSSSCSFLQAIWHQMYLTLALVSSIQSV